MVEAPDLLKNEQAPQEVAPNLSSQTEVKEVAPETGMQETVEYQPTPEEAQKAQELSAQAEQLAPTAHPEPVQTKDPVVKDIENLLAADLTDIYMGLSPAKQQAFKVKGEEVAVSVKQMVDTGKVRAKKILDLIREWLRVIPGVNKFFLEQEAKIKTDTIISYIEANGDAPGASDL